MSYTPLNDILLTGDPRATTPSAGDNDTSVATTAFVQTELADYLPLAGGTMTGDITLGSGVDINFNDTNSGLQWSDVRVSRSAANIIALGSGDKIQQSTAPTVAEDLTNKAYVDGLAAGIDVRASVRAATAAALPAYTRVTNVITADANGALPAIDGVTLVVGNRLLLKDGAAGADNGIYEVTAVGDGSNPFVLTRTTDADSSAEVTAGMFTFVEEGTANGDEGWVLVTNNPITLNTTALTFSQFSSATVVSTLDSLTDVNVTGAATHSLLRFDGTDWVDTEGMLYNETSDQLQISGTGSGAGILIGGDAQWYRSAADTMRTPDALVVDGISTLTGAVTATNGVTATTGGFTATAGDIVATAGNITASAGNIAATVGTLSIGSTSTLTGLVTATGGVTTATGNYTTTSSGGFVASGTGGVSTNSGNISSTSGNLVITAGTSTLGGKVTMSAAQKVAVSSIKTTNYTASLTADYVIRVNSSGGSFTVSLPSGHAAGDTFVIKDVTGSAGTNNVTIDPNASETIDGAATFLMSVNYQSVTVVSDGTNWAII